MRRTEKGEMVPINPLPQVQRHLEDMHPEQLREARLRREQTFTVVSKCVRHSPRRSRSPHPAALR